MRGRRVCWTLIAVAGAVLLQVAPTMADTTRTPPYAHSDWATDNQEPILGTGWATSTASASPDGQLSASSRAVSEAPAGVSVPYTTVSVGYSRGAASGLVREIFSVSQGPVAVTLEFSNVTGDLIYGKERLYAGSACVDCPTSPAYGRAYADAWGWCFCGSGGPTLHAAGYKSYSEAVNGTLTLTFSFDASSGGSLYVYGAMGSTTQAYGDSDIFTAISGTLSSITVSP